MIQYELASTNFPSNGIVNYSTDWESVAKTIYESEYFGREVAKTSYYEADLEELINGKVSRGERITAIFDFVKNRMNWNEKMGYYTDLGVKKAYTEKVGNVADINLMLVSMLREAQIKCNPVLVSTRSNGISVFPNRGRL
jgi:transglutaminase-like putative cysteine protease